MRRQHPHTAGDRLAGRLLAAAEEQQEQAEHRLIVEHVAVAGAGGHERRDHVVAGVGAAGCDERQEQLADALVALRRRARELDLRVADHLLLPVEEHVPAVLRDADDVGDHRGRQRSGERVEDLDPAAVGEPVDQRASDVADRIGATLDGVRREPAADDAPVARVERRVDVLQLVLEIGHVRVEQLVDASRTLGVRRSGPPGDVTQGGRNRASVGALRAVGGQDRREVLRASGDVDDVVVARHHHDVEPRLAEHRTGVAQRPPRRIWIVHQVLVDGQHAFDVRARSHAVERRGGRRSGARLRQPPMVAEGIAEGGVDAVEPLLRFLDELHTLGLELAIRRPAVVRRQCARAEVAGGDQ